MTVTLETIAEFRHVASPPRVSVSTSTVPFTEIRSDAAEVVRLVATTTPPSRSSEPVSSMGASALKTASDARTHEPARVTGDPSFCARIEPPCEMKVLPEKESAASVEMVTPALVGTVTVPAISMSSGAERRAPSAKSVVEEAPRETPLVERSSMDFPR